MNLMIEKTSGNMPDVWNKNVIFFANILSLFYGNESETQVLQQEVGSLESYGCRLIPLLNLLFCGSGNNLLILERKPSMELLAYFEQDIKLTLPEIKIVSHGVYQSLTADSNHNQVKLDLIDYLKRFPADWVDGYVTDATIEHISKITDKKVICTADGSAHGNNKFLLYNFLVDQGLPVFETYIARNQEDVLKGLRFFQSKGYHWAVIKSQIGASGIGMKKVELLNQNGSLNNTHIPDYLFYEGPCLVQGWLDSSFAGVEYVSSPSVQLFLKDDKVSLYDITDQILTAQSVHEGNVAPPPYLAEHLELKEELLRQADIVSKWLHNQSYRGTASIDFHVIKRGRQFEVRVCEINARVTGATYPTILARHFMPQGAWLMRNVRFTPSLDAQTLLEALNENKMLYYPGHAEGILPFNLNPNEDESISKAQFLFLSATTHGAFRLLKKLAEVKSLAGGYDRD